MLIESYVHAMKRLPVVRTRLTIAHRLQKKTRGTYYKAKEAVRVTALVSLPIHSPANNGAVMVTSSAIFNNKATVRATSPPSPALVLPDPSACMTRGISIVPKTLLEISAQTIRGTTELVRQVPVVQLAAFKV